MSAPSLYSTSVLESTKSLAHSNIGCMHFHPFVEVMRMPRFNLHHRWTIIIFILLLGSQSSLAAVERLCKVFYKTQSGWSDGFITEVTFATGAELNKAMKTYEYNSYDRYGVIWFGENEVAIMRIDDLLLGVGQEFTAENFKNAFRIFSEKTATQINDDGGRKWKIEARENLRWIDPRVNR